MVCTKYNSHISAMPLQPCSISDTQVGPITVTSDLFQFWWGPAASTTFSHLLSLPTSHWCSHSQSWWLGSWDCCPSKKPRLIQAAWRNCKLPCRWAVSMCTELMELYNSQPTREQEEAELWSSQEQVHSHSWWSSTTNTTKNYQPKTRGSKTVGWKSICQNPGIPRVQMQ